MEAVFHVADYVLFAITIMLSLGIGVYFAVSGGRQRTTKEYHVGNRRMMVLPVAVSLMVSFESSIMMLGVPAEIYVYGLQWAISKLGYMLAIFLSVVWIVPMFHPLNITSANEYLELRFRSHAVRILGTSLGMLQYVLYMGIVLFGPAIAMEAVTGFPKWASIVLVAVVSVIYTTVGGLKAVIWTDVLQAVIMFIGVFSVLIKGTMEVGGVAKTWKIAYEKGRVNLFNFDPDPTIRHTFWNLFIGSLIQGFGYVFNQSSVQRISSTPTLWDGQKVLLITAPAHCIALLLAAVEGVIAYAYYDIKGCDPLASGQISNPNQIIALMVTDIFRGVYGMSGLFIASLFSASLSTLSSGLSSLSALFWTDIVKPHTKPMSEFKAIIISKCAVIAFGILAISVAFLITLVRGTLTQIAGSILSSTSGPLCGLFMFGSLCPWAEAKGAFWGTAISTVFTFLICIGQRLTKGAVKNQRLPPGPVDKCPEALIHSVVENVTSAYDWVNGSFSNVTSTMTSAYATSMQTMAAMPKRELAEPSGFSRLFMISYKWFGPVGIASVLVIGSIISLCAGRKKDDDVDPKYVVPFIRRFLKPAAHKTADSNEEYVKIKTDDTFTTAVKNEKFNIEMNIMLNEDNIADTNSGVY